MIAHPEDFRPSVLRRRYILAGAVGVVAGVVSTVSYRSGGFVYLLVAGMNNDAASVTAMREWVDGWGLLAPVAYVAAVVVEVLVAPIPGTLLYAPGGALFGGAWGGTLSLIGNVIGATLAWAIARTFGGRLAARLDTSKLAALAERIRRRGIWVILLLRLNPLTSSDLVSYAAGLMRVPGWHVALGTLIGMAPLCYAQAYLAQELFAWLPGSGLVVIGLGVAYLTVVVAVLLGK